MLFAALDTNHYAFLNLENAATKVCPPLNQPNITACFSVKIRSYKMFQALFLVTSNLMKNTAIKVAISYAISYLKKKNINKRTNHGLKREKNHTRKCLWEKIFQSLFIFFTSLIAWSKVWIEIAVMYPNEPPNT